MTMPKKKIRKGDKVVVLAGKNKGAEGEVIKVIPTEDKVLVQGVNMVKIHRKPNQMQAGGIESKEAPIHISNVALADPKTGEPTRIGYKNLKDGKKVRVARKSGETVE